MARKRSKNSRLIRLGALAFGVVVLAWLWREIGGGSGTPATTVESETTFGLAAAVGTDTEYARQDHTHGTPANPSSAAAVSDTVTLLSDRCAGSMVVSRN